MPLFGDTDALADDAATLAPLTQERIEQTLHALEINYGTDEDGELIAGFEGNPCWFRVTGHGDEQCVFSFNGRWKGALPPEQLGAALSFVNEWNATKMFPRAICVQTEDDVVILGADFVIDHEFGVSDLQLRNDISIAITTAMHFFEEASERFPLTGEAPADAAPADEASTDDDPAAEEQ